MYQFFKNMWVMGKATEEDIEVAFLKGRITKEEKDNILNSDKL